ncbi:hypothetical protein BDV95DRAFT_604048 [Massariosphaeria phaeospora]|uniref:Uncharacterized protein n=1 Tax=Massariosphaeria phaeospora TaxID=100035 RepID=A0A7C8IF30_9PLEO|nr:hypothetical protein BDV95DRAFT_604048 [Massariosphaeria phaeospora]
MSPIARHLVQMTQRIRDTTKRSNTLKLIEEATKKPDLAHFTSAILKNPSHTSHSDPTPHATALLATDDQAKNNKSQAVHIYHDENHNYIGHTLYEERDNKTSDG